MTRLTARQRDFLKRAKDGTAIAWNRHDTDTGNILTDMGLMTADRSTAYEITQEGREALKERGE